MLDCNLPKILQFFHYSFASVHRLWAVFPFFLAINISYGAESEFQLWMEQSISKKDFISK